MNMLRRKLSVGALGLASLVGCGTINEAGYNGTPRSSSSEYDNAVAIAIMTQGIVQVPPQARQEVVVNNATTPQKKSSANVIPTEMMRRIEIADRDGLYTALWVDVDGDGNVGNNDRIVEADMYLPLEKMWFIRSTPQRRSLKLYVVDMDLGKAIISGETNNGSERCLIGTFGVLP